MRQERVKTKRFSVTNCKVKVSNEMTCVEWIVQHSKIFARARYILYQGPRLRCHDVSFQILLIADELIS